MLLSSASSTFQSDIMLRARRVRRVRGRRRRRALSALPRSDDTCTRQGPAAGAACSCAPPPNWRQHSLGDPSSKLQEPLIAVP
eukprot:366085-Chlamydomonas_euryale.AAC.11